MRAKSSLGPALSVAVLMLSALACVRGPATGPVGPGISPQASSEPDAVQANRPQCCVILLDGTGSYKNLPRAVQIASQIVATLPGRSLLYVRWISANSIADQAAILSGAIPPEPRPVANVFDPREKAAYAHGVSERQAVLAAITNAFNSLQSPRAPKTDVMGALAAAADRFAANPALDPKLVICTDLEDNIRLSIPSTSLKGVDLFILGFQVRGVETEEVKESWSSRFRDLGARRVTFRHLDDPRPITTVLAGERHE